MQHVQDREADVEADEIGERERSDRMIHPTLHDRVDCLRRTNALHDGEDRFVDHRHEDPVRDEAWIIRGFDGSLPELRAQFRSDAHRVG